MSGEKSQGRVVDMSALAADPHAWMFRHGAALLSGSLLSGDVVRELGGFPDDEFIYGGEDLHFLLRLAAKGQWLHVPRAPYQYRSDLGSSQLHKHFWTVDIDGRRSTTRFIKVW
ncbi:hypothetical protein MK280_12350 [Myxococcota bacterium]|nr:hypothetical protein [Myxococcota bacterium]